ncbi:MAG TPA: molybdenum cofactor guanylyltransferase [Steroidobacteraceae bacterium]
MVNAHSETPDRILGVVIAGGRSVRFGGEKAAALLAGRSLLSWAAERLRGSCFAVGANVRHETEAEAIARAEGLTLLYDEAGDALGPLAGVKVGLKWASSRAAQMLAVSPCDAPLLPPDLFSRLIEAGAGGASFAETAEGPQPLCAIWPVALLPAVEGALAHGAHPSLWRLLDALGAKRVRFESAESFANINTREDLATIAARFGHAIPPG